MRATPAGRVDLGPEGLRELMGHWATGVSVLTSTAADGPRGCTANAVTSLSLDPLLLLACFDLGSNTLQAVRHAGRFAVNILAAGQEDVSRRFAGKGSAKFADVAHELVDEVPVLAGTLAWIVCEVREELVGGDHAIVIGEPLRGESRPDADPLLFFRSRYHVPAAAR